MKKNSLISLLNFEFTIDQIIFSNVNFFEYFFQLYYLNFTIFLTNNFTLSNDTRYDNLSSMHKLKNNPTGVDN